MPIRVSSLLRNALLGAIAGLALSGCQESSIPKQMKPVPQALAEKMRASNMSETGPVLIRIFKESSELEVWKQQRDGKYAHLKTYAICRWSGQLGPKIVEGDRQAPEGFYTVTPAQMNPKSSYYLAFNIGFPNAFDRALGRTGSHLMVHGACSSSGCYSMTDEDAGELFALARDAFRGGQRSFQIQAFPFRMTAENMAKHRDSEHFAFWQMLKTGSDHFELTRAPPKVDVCDRRYVFDADAGDRKFSPSGACPRYEVDEDLKIALAAKQAADETKFGETVTRLIAEAAKAAEDKRVAEAEKAAAEARAAEKLAAKEARSEELSKKLGVFGRLFNRDKKDGAIEPSVAAVPVSADGSDSAAAFAPVAIPIPPKKPVVVPGATPVSVPTPPAIAAPPPVVAVEPAPVVAPAPPPAPAPQPLTETATKPTITPEMTPEIPAVGTFVKKEFNWPGG